MIFIAIKSCEIPSSVSCEQQGHAIIIVSTANNPENWVSY